MTQRRMTTLISKAPFVPSPVKKNLERAEEELKNFLHSRGLQFSVADIAAFVEDLSPEGSKKILSYALDFVRPFTAGLGLRVVRLSDTQVEMMIPARSRTQTQEGELNEGVLVVAAVEAMRHIWNRHGPLGHMNFCVREFRFKKHKEMHGSSRLRMELPEGPREKVLAQLRRDRVTDYEGELALFDEKDQKIAEMTLRVELKWTPALNSTKD